MSQWKPSLKIDTTKVLCKLKRVATSFRSTSRAVKFPDTKERPPPRLPDYLRDSFDLSAFKKDSTTLNMSTQRISHYSSQRYDNIPRLHSHVPTLHSPVINPMERASSVSIKLLELTNDENNQSTIGQVSWTTFR